MSELVGEVELAQVLVLEGTHALQNIMVVLVTPVGISGVNDSTRRVTS